MMWGGRRFQPDVVERAAVADGVDRVDGAVEVEAPLDG
jgi:hypothetical protein